MGVEVLLLGILTMPHELGMNNFVSVVFANADQKCKAFDHRLCKLEMLLCGMGTACSADVLPVEQAGMPKFAKVCLGYLLQLRYRP